MNTQLTEAELLHASGENPQYFDKLMKKYNKPFLRFAGRILPEEAEDIVQEAWIKIFRFSNHLSCDQSSSFKDWAYKIVRNVAVTHYFRAKKAYSKVEPLNLLPGGSLKQEDYTIAIEEIFFARRVLSYMPAEMVSLLIMFYLEGYSYAEICEEHTMSISTLKMRLYYARRKFVDIAKAYGRYERKRR